MDDIKASIKNGRLIIDIAINMKGRPSGSGKTTVHASTNGNVALPVQVNGKVLILGLNAYTK